MHRNHGLYTLHSLTRCHFDRTRYELEHRKPIMKDAKRQLRTNVSLACLGGVLACVAAVVGFMAIDPWVLYPDCGCDSCPTPCAPRTWSLPMSTAIFLGAIGVGLAGSILCGVKTTRAVVMSTW